MGGKERKPCGEGGAHRAKFHLGLPHSFWGVDVELFEWIDGHFVNYAIIGTYDMRAKKATFVEKEEGKKERDRFFPPYNIRMDA